jgi:hypothetical protein
MLSTLAGPRCGPGTVEVMFDGKNPQAVQWAERHSAQLVTNLTDDARSVVRSILTQAFNDGVSPRATAKLLRDVVGLSERYAQAVYNYRLKLVNKDLSPEAIERLTSKYAAELNRARAEAIARTEGMTAANQGQQQLWNQAVERGLLDGTELKIWLVADPCPICAPMEDKTTALNGSFPLAGPPAHPNCRCTIGLVIP